MVELMAQEMMDQDKRSTAWPIFIVVENKKVYGVDPNFRDCERERKDIDNIEKDDLCDNCREVFEEGEVDLPKECGNYECDDSFIYYRIEEDVPNMRAGFFFTAKACDEHIQSQAHHYDDSAKSYAISAYYNEELRMVMTAIVGTVNVHKIT